MQVEGLVQYDYAIMVSRSYERPQVALWPMKLREPLPSIPIPLKREDPVAIIDLQQLLHTTFDAAATPTTSIKAKHAPHFIPKEKPGPPRLWCLSRNPSNERRHEIDDLLQHSFASRSVLGQLQWDDDQVNSIRIRQRFLARENIAINELPEFLRIKLLLFAEPLECRQTLGLPEGFECLGDLRGISDLRRVLFDEPLNKLSLASPFDGACAFICVNL